MPCSRALLRALKKAKGFEQAKLARSLKVSGPGSAFLTGLSAAALTGPLRVDWVQAAVAAGQPALDIQARQTATKSLETGHLFLKAVEKHKLQALLAHNPKSTVTAKCGGAAAAAGGGGGGADAEAAVAAEQHAVQRVINATAVRSAPPRPPLSAAVCCLLLSAACCCYCHHLLPLSAAAVCCLRSAAAAICCC